MPVSWYFRSTTRSLAALTRSTMLASSASRLYPNETTQQLLDTVREDDRAYSYSAGARTPLITPWRLSLGGDVLYFSNPLTEGYTAHLRASRSFDGGRRVFLDVGRRQWQPRLADVSQSAQWFRLGGDVELRRNLSLRSEYEISSGDSLAGRRALIGVRYRLRSRP